ncbi:hypothetical protein B0H10DRAFT_1957049 [Mycena sp. CBHHK59/15]|nr:hypothetical protein B0H10DRAFT_1957049 [Mycena sp. CBHHK59/15]
MAVREDLYGWVTRKKVNGYGCTTTWDRSKERPLLARIYEGVGPGNFVTSVLGAEKLENKKKDTCKEKTSAQTDPWGGEEHALICDLGGREGGGDGSLTHYSHFRPMGGEERRGTLMYDLGGREGAFERKIDGEDNTGKISPVTIKTSIDI